MIVRTIVQSARDVKPRRPVAKRIDELDMADRGGCPAAQMGRPVVGWTARLGVSDLPLHPDIGGLSRLGSVTQGDEICGMLLRIFWNINSGSSSDLRESENIGYPPPRILTKMFPFGCKLLCFRVIFRGWEWSHSIRSEILSRY